MRRRSAPLTAGPQTSEGFGNRLCNTLSQNGYVTRGAWCGRAQHRQNPTQKRGGGHRTSNQRAIVHRISEPVNINSANQPIVGGSFVAMAAAPSVWGGPGNAPTFLFGENEAGVLRRPVYLGDRGTYVGDRGAWATGSLRRPGYVGDMGT